LNALGDSKNIIRMMVHGSDPRDLSLKQIMDRIRVESQDIKITFYHIMREHNKEADKMANAAIGKTLGSLSVEGVETSAPLF
jgi:hypothetical protein